MDSIFFGTWFYQRVWEYQSTAIHILRVFKNSQGKLKDDILLQINQYRQK